MSQKDFYSDILYAESRQARPPSKDFARVELTKDKLQIHHWMINSSRLEPLFSELSLSRVVFMKTKGRKTDVVGSCKSGVDCIFFVFILDFILTYLQVKSKFLTNNFLTQTIR